MLAYLYLLTSRLLLTPHASNARLDTFVRLRWETGGSISEELSDCFSPNEQLFFDDYNSMLAEYMEGLGGLDLTTVRILHLSLA